MEKEKIKTILLTKKICCFSFRRNITFYPYRKEAVNFFSSSTFIVQVILNKLIPSSLVDNELQKIEQPRRSHGAIENLKTMNTNCLQEPNNSSTIADRSSILFFFYLNKKFLSLLLSY